MFYEAVGLMISADTDAKRRDEYLARLMGPPNATWQQIIEQARGPGLPLLAACLLLLLLLCSFDSAALHVYTWHVGCYEPPRTSPLVFDSAAFLCFSLSAGEAECGGAEAGGGDPQRAEHPAGELLGSGSETRNMAGWQL